jgi:hypothetical protein
MPARPRTPRNEIDKHTREALVRWERFVRWAESRAAAWPPIGCPGCDGDVELDARELLEAVIQRGGRRGRRVERLVEPLDERFHRATTPDPSAPENAYWWLQRYLE